MKLNGGRIFFRVAHAAFFCVFHPRGVGPVMQRFKERQLLVRVSISHWLEVNVV